MTKIWYCASCGYEVDSRGRCHRCRQRLVPSPLPELVGGADEDEVGYRLGAWSDAARVRLIEELIDANVLHRFEEDELVVMVDDEDRVDALVSAVSRNDATGEDAAVDVVSETVDDHADGADPDLVDWEDAEDDSALAAEVELLGQAARRLSADPTDMEADGEVAQASTAVFTVDHFSGASDDTWAAVGRVTRRLMAALGADDALEDEIRNQATILARLIEPLVARHQRPPVGPTNGHAVDPSAADPSAVDPSAADAGTEARGPEPTDPAAGAPSAPPGAGPVASAGPVDAGVEEVTETVYELGEWLPEQRAELAMLLDSESIAHAWDGENLVVKSDREADVERVLDRIEANEELDQDEEARYRSLEELFAATNRFVNDPTDRTKRTEVVRTVAAADGPTPVGLDDAQWWQIRQRARTLADSIEHRAQTDVMLGEARVLRELLHGLM